LKKAGGVVEFSSSLDIFSRRYQQFHVLVRFPVNAPPHQSSTLRPVVTFLNHGILPFVGRDGDIRRLVGFWQQTTSDPALRAMLVTAEAGMGKSRLAEELLLQVGRTGGAVVHLRFYPDASLSLAPLLAQAVRSTASGQQLLAAGSEGASSTSLLRRLASLRPTMLVMEDLHLLSGDPLRELQQLLYSIADLPIALVLLTRPIELSVRGVIEPYLVDELHLHGLDTGQIELLLTELFGGTITEWMPQVLHQITLGNPLALRSALRSAATSGALAPGGTGSWSASLDRVRFTELLTRAVRVLAEGMVAHLDARERETAIRLAALGEVFAADTARAPIGDTDEIMESLLFRGVLVPLMLPTSPIIGDRSGSDILVFSHTLLHRMLIGGEQLPPDRIIVILADGLPLYSLMPIESLANANLTDVSIGIDRIDRAIWRLVERSTNLYGTSDWQQAETMLHCADRLFHHAGEQWEPERRKEIEAMVLRSRMLLTSGERELPKHRDIIQKLLDLTSTEQSDTMLEHRIYAIACRCAAYPKSQEIFQEGREEIEQIATAFPHLQISESYVQSLRDLTQLAIVMKNWEYTRWAEERLEELLSSGRLSGEFAAWARKAVLLKLIPIFKGPEQLDRRLGLLAEFEAGPGGMDHQLAFQKMLLLVQLARSTEFIALADEWIPRLYDVGHGRSASQLEIIRICEPVLFGESIEIALNDGLATVENSPPVLQQSVRNTLYYNLVRKGLLTGNADFVLTLEPIIQPQQIRLDRSIQMLMALHADDRNALDSIIDRDHPGIEKLAQHLLDQIQDVDEALLAELQRILERPVLQTSDPIHLRIIYLLVRLLRQQEATAWETALLPWLRTSLEAAMAWHAERDHIPCIASLLHEHEGWLTKRGRESWNARLRQLRERRRIEHAPSEESLSIRVIGALEARLPGGRSVAIRGGRLRLLLGLLVVDQMLATPLGHREFCQIASGEDDPERARKSMNGAVMRLRDVIGEEAIVTDGETPRLNRSRVEVDLLNALRLCSEARESLRSHLLAGAMSSVRQALDIWNGEVPFPALYENLFEAAREDFESEMRTATLLVARTLLAEDDPTGAEELLRRAVMMLPGDEEMAELLAESLRRSGQRLEVERLKLGDEEAVR
jgi:DNA-binding SARP family transcriptional activator